MTTKCLLESRHPTSKTQLYHNLGISHTKTILISKKSKAMYYTAIQIILTTFPYYHNNVLAKEEAELRPRWSDGEGLPPHAGAATQGFGAAHTQGGQATHAHQPSNSQDPLKTVKINNILNSPVLKKKILYFT